MSLELSKVTNLQNFSNVVLITQKNFDAIMANFNAMDARVKQLETKVAALEAKVK